MAFKRNIHRYNTQVFEHPSLENLNTLPRGKSIHSVAFSNRKVELLVDNRGAECTTVIFHAALPWKKIVLPVFVGLTVTAGLETNVILVSDTGLDREVNLAWFAGDAECPLQEILPSVLQRIIELIPENRRVITYGSSGGGFASLYYAADLHPSIAIAANPQTDISRYLEPVVDRYVKNAWRVESIDEAPIVFDAAKRYAAFMPNPVVYLQALGDNHIQRHLVPFFEAASDRGAIGLKLIENGRGHTPPSKEIIAEVLSAAVASGGDWTQLGDSLGLDRASSVSTIQQAQVDYLATLE